MKPKHPKVKEDFIRVVYYKKGIVVTTRTLDDELMDPKYYATKEEYFDKDAYNKYLKKYKLKSLPSLKNKPKLDPFHYHEMLDRTIMVADIIESHLVNHIAVSEEQKEKLDIILRLLYEVYEDSIH